MTTADTDDPVEDEPWYRGFFGSVFWTLVQDEYVDERTATEVGYLAGVLGELAPGRRVLDLGCGQGRHARGLADRGFTVTAVDVSPAVLAPAAEHPGVVHATADLLAADPWPGDQVDAAILVQGLGWGSDADQRRLLTRIHERLRPGGILVLDLSAAAWILRHFLDRGTADTVAGRVILERDYDPLTGRVGGAMTLQSPAGTAVRARQSVRLYPVDQALDLVVGAGFEVVRVDGDFVAGAPVNMDSRYVQIVCRRAARPPESLAISVRTSLPGATLDLQWTPDEAAFVEPTPLEVWRRWWPADPADQLHLCAAYDFDDPYGGRRAAPLLSELHGVPLAPEQILFGAGATALLATLAGLAERGPVVSARYGHRDVGAWAATAGSRLVVTAEPLATSLPDGADTVSLVVVDRPDPLGLVSDLAELAEAGRRLAGRGAVLVVDESYANYLGPAASAVALVDRLPNLVVVRGLAKGYCLGGLRSGWAVCSPELATRLRVRAVPLGTSAASLRFTLELLAEGDVFARLRRRADDVRAEVQAALWRAGVDTAPGTPGLPWLTAVNGAAAAGRLSGLGIGVKRLDPVDGQGGPVVRIALPLSDERVARLHEALGRDEAS